ncbi:MAG: hypothetical protein KAI70_00755 [Candidatus Omnitrophica bacterium]|nr:hypothetical protein [Candidatus Omnitrophota bacterium]
MAKRKPGAAPYKNYEANHQKIYNAYLEITKENGNIIPSYKSIAKRAGVSVNTVDRHFKHLDWEFLLERQKIHSPAVIDAISRNAKAGNIQAQKLYAEIVERHIQRSERRNNIGGSLDVTTKVSGDLQVHIQRRIIRTREELNAAYGKTPQLTIEAAKEIKNVVCRVVEPTPTEEPETDEKQEMVMSEDMDNFLQ